MTYLDLRAFSTFHICSLTALEPKLTAVAWRAQKSQNSDAEDHQTFPETYRILRFFLIAHKKFRLIYSPALHARSEHEQKRRDPFRTSHKLFRLRRIHKKLGVDSLQYQLRSGSGRHCLSVLAQRNFVSNLHSFKLPTLGLQSISKRKLIILPKLKFT